MSKNSVKLPKQPQVRRLQQAFAPRHKIPWQISENLTVLASPVTALDYLNYEEIFHESIDATLVGLGRIAEVNAEDTDEVLEILKSGFFSKVIRFIAWLFSTRGQVIGTNDDGSFETKPISWDEVASEMPMEAIFEMVHKGTFSEILKSFNLIRETPEGEVQNEGEATTGSSV